MYFCLHFCVHCSLLPHVCIIVLKVHERPSFDDDQFGNFFEVRCGIVQLQMETCARRMYFCMFQIDIHPLYRYLKEVGEACCRLRHGRKA